MPRRWLRLGTTIVFENSRLRVLEDAVVQPDGYESSYTVVEMQTGAVVVVPVTDDHRLVLIRQHRYPIDEVLLELPAGELPNGSDPLEQARHELLEETGITATHVKLIGQFAPWPARVRRRTLIALATGLDLEGLAFHRQSGDESIEEIRLCEAAEVRALLARGEILDGPTLCALAVYGARFASSAKP